MSALLVSLRSQLERMALNAGSALPLAAGRLQDAALGADEVPLGSVADAVGASYALLFAERAADGKVEAPLLAGINPAYGSRLRQAGTLRLLPAWLRGLQPGMVMDRASLQRDHDFARSAFFDYVVRPEGRFHCLITTPHATPLQRFHLIVGRPMGRDDFSPEDIRVLQALLPHVGRLIRSGMALFQAGHETAVLRSALDHLSGSIVVVTGDCRLVFANKGAQRLLDLRDGLHRAGGSLAAAGLADTVALRGAVARALDGHGRAASALHVRRPSGGPPFAVAASPLDTGLPAGAALVLLLIAQADPSAVVDASPVARCYGLTARESELATLLASGLDLRCAAGRLGIGYSTARFHLRHVFEKTGTHRQSDLVRLVLAASPRLSR